MCLDIICRWLSTLTDFRKVSGSLSFCTVRFLFLSIDIIYELQKCLRFYKYILITKIIIYNPQYLLFGVIISIRSELIISSIFVIIIISSASKYNEYLIVIIVFSPLEYILIFIFGTNPLFLIYLQFIICD